MVFFIINKVTNRPHLVLLLKVLSFLEKCPPASPPFPYLKTNLVNFHYNLSTASNKKNCVPDFLKKLALEIINNIPLNDIKIHTDGSKTDKQAGSRIYTETLRDKYSIKQCNPDFCSVFRSELLAIDVVLLTIMSESNFGDLWILTDSRSSIQHLKNWTYIGDKTSLSILQKLKLISLQHEVHFQWIPSHVDIHGNELADNLAKEGSSHPTPSSSEITFLELFSQKKGQNKAEWLVPPSCHGTKEESRDFPCPFHATGSPVPVFHDLTAAT
ncbi:hypothetical protein AVEN_131935-1 [Araneus ventricosus]|uniref:ribonuclease H n=1 Tax=Araneus ventricosus TaxID=182803 RepID=A0A4Y2B2G8_ARAVE|nr:hypothetical protein AVEN_131935-1 [Araneus ventricosus]